MVSQIKANEIIKQSGSSITIGESGDTIDLSNPTSVTLNSDMKNTPSFSVKLGSNQTISNASDTKITLDTENWDTDSAFASNKFTVPSGKAGKYLFVFSARTDLAIDTQAYCYVFKNGSQILESTTGTVKPNATCTAHMTGSVMVDLAVSDYVELYIYQNSGSSQLAYANYCALMGERLIGA